MLCRSRARKTRCPRGFQIGSPAASSECRRKGNLRVSFHTTPRLDCGRTCTVGTNTFPRKTCSIVPTAGSFLLRVSGLVLLLRCHLDQGEVAISASTPDDVGV